MRDSALSFRGVCRSFRGTRALADLDLRVEPGTILGLVGRNGAGKTTALRLALGDLYPDAGEIRVLGLEPRSNHLEIRRRVSLLAEEGALYPWMSVGEILRFGSRLHPRWDAALAADLSGRLRLEPDKKIRALSRGGRAKVALVLAVACRPDMLLLDDPTAGLDPFVRREVLGGILETYPSEGGAVVYASHLIHDLERVADRIVVLDEGRKTLEGDLDDLRSRIIRASAVFPGAAPTDLEIPGRLRTQSQASALQVVAEAGAEQLESALRAAGATRVEISPLALEDILIACLGEDAAAVPTPGNEVQHV